MHHSYSSSRLQSYHCSQRKTRSSLIQILVSANCQDAVHQDAAHAAIHNAVLEDATSVPLPSSSSCAPSPTSSHPQDPTHQANDETNAGMSIPHLTSRCHTNLSQKEDQSGMLRLQAVAVISWTSNANYTLLLQHTLSLNVSEHSRRSLPNSFHLASSSRMCFLYPYCLVSPV